MLFRAAACVAGAIPAIANIDITKTKPFFRKFILTFHFPASRRLK